MDVKMGLSVTRAADENKSSEFQFAKHHKDPHFQSKETETMFILTAQLRGYSKERVKIDINEDGTVMSIGGEKPVEEMIMVGWKVYKKGIELRRFKKAFRIPEGVILDDIKAKFNEDENILTISMPKKVKGIVGKGIEEIDSELIRQDSEDPKEEREESTSETLTDHPENQENVGETVEKAVEKNAADDQIGEGQVEKHEMKQPIQESREVDEQARTENPQNRFKTLAPLVAGSALLLSIVAFAFHVVKTKHQSVRRKD